MPKSRVSRSQNVSARLTDSLYSFMKIHPVDMTAEARRTTNEKTAKKLIDCAL